MRVIDLLPGDVVEQVTIGGVERWTFIATCPHPLYGGFNLVIWRNADGRWSHDALSAVQEVGEAVAATAETRREALREALHQRERV